MLPLLTTVPEAARNFDAGKAGDQAGGRIGDGPAGSQKNANPGRAVSPPE